MADIPDLDRIEQKYALGKPMSLAWEPKGQWVFYGSGRYALPERFTFTADAAGHPRCTFEFAVEDGRLVCEALRVERRPGEPPISQNALRKINVADWARVARMRVAMELVTDADGRAELRPVVMSARMHDPTTAAELMNDYLKSYEATAKERRRGVRLGDDHFRRIAQEYRDAIDAGSRRPAQEIAEREFTSPQNARRWIMEARRRGFLGEAVAPRQAGERRRSTRKGGE